MKAFVDSHSDDLEQRNNEKPLIQNESVKWFTWGNFRNSFQ